MRRLRECPLCGGEAEWMTYQFKYVTGIVCYGCDIKMLAEDVMIGRSGNVEDVLADRWNKRKE